MAKPQMTKSQVKKPGSHRGKHQRAVEQTAKHRQTLKGRIGLYAAISLVLLASAYWGYGKMTEKVTWIAVPILPSPHVPLGTPHPPYNSEPPTSGPHAPGLAQWGIHAEPIPKEMQVHNLEDGGVAINYSCQDCLDLVRSLTAIAERYDRVLLAPYPGLDRRIALTAWGSIDKFDAFDETRIVKFIKAHIGIDHHGAGG